MIGRRKLINTGPIRPVDRLAIENWPDFLLSLSPTESPRQNQSDIIANSNGVIAAEIYRTIDQLAWSEPSKTGQLLSGNRLDANLPKPIPTPDGTV